MPDQRPLPRASRIGAERRPLPERKAAPGRAAAPALKHAGRPDPRPMRAVYGAGAVAAVSIMAVGLVQPDWSAAADPGASDEGAVAVLSGDKAELVQSDPTPGERAKGTNPRHVTRYIYLKPGQTAPPGATVVWASAPPASNTGRNHPNRPVATASPRPRNNGGGNNGGGSVSRTPAPTQRATQPPPRPTPTTRQSG